MTVCAGCPTESACPEDLNADGAVNAAWALADTGVGHQAQPPDCHERCRTPDRRHAGLPRTIPADTALVGTGFALFRELKESWYAVSETMEEGQREFLAQDPDGYLMRFAQPPKPTDGHASSPLSRTALTNQSALCVLASTRSFAPATLTSASRGPSSGAVPRDPRC